jgi:hypothetical protein
MPVVGVARFHSPSRVRAAEIREFHLPGKVRADDIHEFDSSFETTAVTDVDSSSYLLEAVDGSDEPLKRERR